MKLFRKRARVSYEGKSYIRNVYSKYTKGKGISYYARINNKMVKIK